MYKVNWIDNTGWDLYKRLGFYPKSVNIVVNTLIKDFSVFKDFDLNVFLCSEPPEIIKGNTEYCIKYADRYDFILAWDKNILSNCKNARKLMYLDTWLTDDYILNYPKKYDITFLRGYKNITKNHGIRWDIYNRKDQLNAPHSFYDTISWDKMVRQNHLFINSQFNLAIENSIHDDYFTEKILDCFLTLTMPIYLGCPNINKYFYPEGIITIRDADDFFDKMNRYVDASYYDSKIDYVRQNYKIARQMCSNIGDNGYKQLDSMIDSLILEKFYGF